MGGVRSTNGGEEERGKARGKEPLGTPRHRRLDNIRIELVQVGWGDVDWIGLAQGRDRWTALVNSVLNLRVP
jgi:predicted small integral membrane protein